MTDSLPPITRHFLVITDPRADNHAHKLIDIIMIAICAVLAGADSFVDIADFGHDRETWLRGFLELPHGIPSEDTFSRVFALLDPKELQSAFADWIRFVVTLTGLKLIAIDGKTNLRQGYKAPAPD